MEEEIPLILQAVERSRPVPRGWFWFLLVLAMPVAAVVLGKMYLEPLAKPSEELQVAVAALFMLTVIAVIRSYVDSENSGSWLKDFLDKNVIGRTLYFYLDNAGELQWGVQPRTVCCAPDKVVANFALGGFKKETIVTFGKRDLRSELNPQIICRRGAEHWIFRIEPSAPPILIRMPRFDADVQAHKVIEMTVLLPILQKIAQEKERCRAAGSEQTEQ